MIFGVDINRLIQQLTPHHMNKPKHNAWLQVLLYPVVWLYAAFLTYRADKLKEATINSQVIRFTRALRDRFVNENIVIIHPVDFLGQSFIYLEIEGATLEYDYLGIEAHVPVNYDFLQAEYDIEYDFIVRIPALIASKQAAVIAFVNIYKLAGKRFKVEII